MLALLKNKWFIYVAGLAFFFILFRYCGYFEDAGRYLLQALHSLYPERFVDDVPFMYGNQDSFTVFSPLLIVFFRIWGVNHGGMVAVLLLEFFWGVAAITLFVRWFKQWGKLEWALPCFIACLVVLTNKIYGSGDYFLIIDHILVARFAAEGFILLGLAFLCSRNRYVSLVMFLLASALNPLMGGWGIPLWLVFHYPRLCCPLTIAVVLAPLTGFLHVGRLDFFPSDWFEGALPFSPVGNDALVFSGILVFWWTAWKFSKNANVSRFAKVIFWLCLMGVFWQYVGTGLRHQLLAQAQPYRVLWLTFVPMVPVASLGLWDYFREPSVFSRWLDGKTRLLQVVFGASLVFLVVSGLLDNVVKLALEQNYERIDVAFLQDVLACLAPLNKGILVMLLVACLARRRFWLAAAFGVSLLNGSLTILPMIATVYFLFPSINGWLKNLLVSVAVVFSLFEYLSSLIASPLLKHGAQGFVFLILLFVLVFWVACLCGSSRSRAVWIPFSIMIVLFVLFDISNWDSRSEWSVSDERQMDAFFDKPIFPQVQNRGRMLFVESREFPLQSRFKFLTGTYADRTINIGDFFYRGQFLDARFRKNALLLGDTALGNWGNYIERIADIYASPDSLLSRVRFLCGIGEISHFVSDYDNMALPRQDSAYLKVKHKFVWLYGCPVE